MSNTWPHKGETSPQERDISPWRDTSGSAKGNTRITTSGNFHSVVLVFRVMVSSCVPPPAPPGERLSSRSSPRPLRASLVSSSSTSSFRRALSSTRATFCISPVVPPVEPAQIQNGQKSNSPCSPQNHQLDRSLHLDSDSFSASQDPAEDDALNMQEVRKL